MKINAPRGVSNLIPTGALALLLLATPGNALAQDVALTSVRVASGLTRPLFATSAPGDPGRLFVVEQPGVVRILDLMAEPPSLLAAPFLDIQDRVNDTDFEQGLLGLAFHPKFAKNGHFFVSYTDANGDSKVARFHVPPATPDDADETSELLILEIAEPDVNHNVGWLGFGPSDRLLYIGSGDGGGFRDDNPGHPPEIGNGQDSTNLLGAILRIDVDRDDAPGGHYGIPGGNPFASAPGADEIWAYGLRNPWRNAFDPLTGELYIADVGEDSWEEVNIQPGDSVGGENWGWRCREGAHNFNFSGGCAAATLLDPVHEYSHGGSPFRCSITGGEVYRGCAIPELHGAYFFADYCSNQIWSFQGSGGTVSGFVERTAALDPPGAQTIDEITSFGRDAEGEIYVVDGSGEVFKIVPDGPAAECPIPVAASTWGARLSLGLVLVGVALLSLGALRVRRSRV